jgi:hypothetical protein
MVREYNEIVDRFDFDFCADAFHTKKPLLENNSHENTSTTSSYRSEFLLLF